MIDGWFGSWSALVQRIMADQSVDSVAAMNTAKDLEALDPSLRPAFLRWLATGELNRDFAVGGYSIADILRCKGSRVGISGAFTFLDGMVKCPNETIAAIETDYSLDVWGKKSA